MKRFAIYLITLASLSAVQPMNGQTMHASQPVHYRLKYYPPIQSGTGWDYNQIQREELLTINPDFTYTIERVYPLGSFEVIPDSGKCEIKNRQLILTSSITHHTRIFQVTVIGLIEPDGKGRQSLSNMLWRKE